MLWRRRRQTCSSQMQRWYIAWTTLPFPSSALPANVYGCSEHVSQRSGSDAVPDMTQPTLSPSTFRLVPFVCHCLSWLAGAACRNYSLPAVAAASCGHAAGGGTGHDQCVGSKPVALAA